MFLALVSRIVGSRWLRGWIRDSSLVLVSQASALLVTTGLTIVVARQLGPSTFGLLAAFQGAAQVVTVFVDAGIATFLLRELSPLWAGGPSEKSSRRTNELVGACFSVTVTAGTSLGAVALAFGTLALGSFTLGGALAAIVGYTAVLACSDSLEVVYRAQRRLRFLAAAIAIEKGLLALLVVLVLVLHRSILAIAVAYICAGLARVSFDSLTIRRLGIHPRRPTLRRMGRALRSALPFGLGITAPSAVVRFDTTLIGLFSTSSAGLYAIGDRILTSLLIVPSTASATLYPVLARESSTRGKAARAAAILFCGGVVAAAVVIVVCPSLIPALFGHQYADAVRVVEIMLLATPLIYGGSMLMTGLFVAGRERTVVTVMLSCTVVGTALVVIGEWLFGVRGAAAGYALRYVVFFLALAVTLARTEAVTAPAAEAAPSKEDRSREAGALPRTLPE